MAWRTLVASLLKVEVTISHSLTIPHHLERKYLLETSREPIKLMRRAYMIFHEVAHLWFGDYTSIDWWNNLFLKEGMATFFGIKMLQEYSEQH